VDEFTFSFEVLIQRSHRYLETAFTYEPRAFDKLTRLAYEVTMPRYVGVIRLEGPFLGRLDLLVDTTNTLRNTYLLAAVASSSANDMLCLLGERLIDRYGGVLIS
jgi:hypothetical protein